MSFSDFVHLNLHSAYSLLEGALPVNKIIDLCIKHQMPAVAVTDSHNLFGSLEFSLSASQNGIQPIIGCTASIRGVIKEQTSSPFSTSESTDKLTLLVQNETGYRNLLHLMSSSYLETDPHDDPHIMFEKLAENSEGLLALSGGAYGTVERLISKKNEKGAKEALDRFLSVFKDRFYFELMRHGDFDVEREEITLDWAFDKGIPIVASNEVYFASPTEYQAHDALICIAEGKYVSQSDRRTVTPDHFFKSPREMKLLFDDVPEAIQNTLLVAQRCSYMPQAINPILPVCPKIKDITEEQALKDLSYQGLKEQLSKQQSPIEDEEKKKEFEKPYFDRLDFELNIIIQMGFQGYFLIVADFIQWSKDNNIPVGPGRGSGAGSVVAWALSITDLDPLRWGLLFERFLNPERVSMPDFDIDFCQDRRGEVIRYVQEQYGYNKVAQIITFGKLQARAVLRDVGRVLQMPYGQVDRICRLVPNNPANPTTLSEAIEAEPLLRRMAREDDTVKSLIDMSLQLEGLYRHASTHAAGVVIGDRPLEELVPLYRDPRSDMPVTQFNLKFVEKAGLVKFDFLGLKTLTVLAKSIELIKERHKDSDIDLSDLPLDHKGTYEMISRGDTVGVFQLESAGMKDALKKMKPDRFEDIIAVVALYRPGPMDNIPKYIACKHGQEVPDYLHPTLEPILKETFGIMIYQEQVMQIAQTLSGYSLGEADLLRRAMGKKIKEEMEAQRLNFVEGAKKNKVDGKKADEIFEQVNKFAGYGFNKSHAAAYALIAYQTAYLKANFQVEFMTALMTLDISNTEKLDVFRQELKKLNLQLLPPNVNKSQSIFSVEETEKGPAIRYALAALKGAGQQAMDLVCLEREENGEYEDLFDFLTRQDSRVLNKKQLESLICAGALDDFNPNRAQLFRSVEFLIQFAQSNHKKNKDQQSLLLFTPDADEEFIKPSLPETESWSMNEKLQREFDSIGFFMSAHPLDIFHSDLENLAVTSSVDLFQKSQSGTVKLAGILIKAKERKSAKGNKWAFLSLSDSTGAYEVAAFSEVLNQSREYLEEGRALVIHADVQSDTEGLRITAQSITPLEEVVKTSQKSFTLNITSSDQVEKIKPLIEDCPKGKTTIFLNCDVEDKDGMFHIEMKLPEKYYIPPEIKEKIVSL